MGVADGMNRVALVTGGTRGIGAAIVRALEQDGWKVGIAARSLGVDVASLEELRRLVDGAATRWGAVDALVCCAGIAGGMGFGNGSQAEALAWEETMETNLLGTVHACWAVLPHMQEQRRGRIVTFAGGGVGGSKLAKHRVAYVTSKFAVVGFTEALALELEPEGILVNAVSPGKVATDMTGGEGGSPDDAVRMVKWLLEGPPELVGSGRLYAAKWDTPWRWSPGDLGRDDWCKLRRETFGGAT
jgi:NAD(P)-dependent dehydrogenase (short-subunit alcohol dehydrogenase family)